MSGKLARVQWRMGQTLLPEHFLAQEEALLFDTVLRFRVQGLPIHGVAALVWNDTLLAEGVLSLKTATVVFPSGLLVDVPGNALAAPVNLNVPGTARVAVYLHCRDELASEDDAAASWTAGDPGQVPRRIYQVALSADQSLSDALETMKLAEFRKGPNGVWQLSEEYVPPLLQVGSSPFLQSALEELPPMLEAFHYKLAMDSVSYLSGSSLFNVKQCLKAVYRIQRFLANLHGQVKVHPYWAYEVLKEFYTEVCIYRDSSPKDVAEPYNHDQLADCFRRILVPLKEQMQLAEKRSPYLPFEFREGVYRLELPSEIKQAKQVYFLIQKSQVNRAVGLEDFKLASPSRLAMTHKLALQGIPLKKVDRPMLAHSFGPEVDFHELVLGDEWDHALREGAAAFYHKQSFQDLEFYLYWHVG